MLADADGFEFEDFEVGSWGRAEQNAEQAFALYEDGKLGGALLRMDAALDINPANGVWHFNKGLILDGLGNFDKAIGEYKLALESNPTDVEILNSLAVDYTRCGFYDLAIEVFEQIEGIDSTYEPAYCNRIIAYTEMDKYDLAEEMFYLAQQINPDCPLCYYNMGNLFFIRGEYKRAKWCWKKTCELDSSHPRINYRIGQACWALSDNDCAKEHFLVELCVNPGDIDVIFDFGVLLLESGEVESAKEKFNRVLELSGGYGPALHYLGEIAFSAGDYEGSRKFFLEALEEDANLAGPRYRLSQFALNEGQRNEAIELLVCELSLVGEDVEVLISMGSMFLELDSLDHAVHCFVRALDVEPEKPEALGYLGLALAMRGDFGDAADLLGRCVSLKPEATVLSNWAGACLLSGKFKQAESKIDAARLLAPNDREVSELQRQIRRAVLSGRVRTFLKKLKPQASAKS